MKTEYIHWCEDCNLQQIVYLKATVTCVCGKPMEKTGYIDYKEERS